MAKKLKQNRVLGVKVGPAHPKKKTPAAKAAAPAPAKIKEAVWKPIVSTDARKPIFMAELKAASGCRKVTMVEISKDGTTIRGNCMNPGGPGATVGFVTAPTPSDAPPADLRGEEVAALVVAEHAPAKEKTPARARPKLVIEDACAAGGCTNPPLPGAMLCGEHAIAGMRQAIEKGQAAQAAVNKVIADVSSSKPTKSLKEEAQTVCVEPRCNEVIRSSAPHRRCDKHRATFMVAAQKVAKKVEAEINAQLAQPETKAALGRIVAQPPAGEARFHLLSKTEARAEAMRMTRALVAAGHKVSEMASLCGVTDGSVYRWYRAASAPTPFQFFKLEELADRAPATAAAGSIQAPRKASGSAKAIKFRKDADPRQLMLELRDALNAVLAASAPAK